MTGQHSDIDRQIADRRQQWQHLTPHQHMTKIQRALLDTIDHARTLRKRRAGHSRIAVPELARARREES